MTNLRTSGLKQRLRCNGFASEAAAQWLCLGGEMVDTRDLKSLDPKGSCGFDSRPRHDSGRANCMVVCSWPFLRFDLGGGVGRRGGALGHLAFVKFTWSLPLLIIKQLTQEKGAGEDNLVPPGTAMCLGVA